MIVALVTMFVWKLLCAPGTQMGPLVLIGKGLVLGGLTFKDRGHLGSRQLLVYSSICMKKMAYHSMSLLSLFPLLLEKILHQL